MTPYIVVGYDGSPRGIDALALGDTFAELIGATPVVACVYRLSQAVSARIGPDPQIERSVERARATLAAAPLAGFGSAPMQLRAIGGTSPAEALRGLAARTRADLIVLGSTTKSGLTRVSPGSVAERLMHGAPCALAIAPAGHASEPHDLRTVAVAFDGRDEARLALATAVSLARRAGASLRILRAIDSRHGDLPRDAEEQLEEATALAPGVPTSTSVLDADPADPAAALVAATRDDADLLVTGSRAHGPLRRVLVGSVSGRLMRTAACPVCVVPRGVALGFSDALAPERVAGR